MDSADFSLVDTELLFKTTIFDIARYTFTLPSKTEASRTVVRHCGSVVFMPITDDGMLVLTRQYRAAVDEILLEFPAGTFDHKGESPLDCAMREIREEVGYQAKTWTALGYHYPSPGYCDHREYDFVARDLYPSTLKGPEEEIIEVVHMSAATFEASIQNGLIKDCKSIALYMKAKLLRLI